MAPRPAPIPSQRGLGQEKAAAPLPGRGGGYGGGTESRELLNMRRFVSMEQERESTGQTGYSDA